MDDQDDPVQVSYPLSVKQCMTTQSDFRFSGPENVEVLKTIGMATSARKITSMQQLVADIGVKKRSTTLQKLCYL